MTMIRNGTFGLLLGGLVALGMQACDHDNVGGALLEQCGLVCDDQALIKGKFAVSGIAGVDAFFSAVLDVSGAASATARDIQVELNALYGLVGASGPGDFQAKLKAKLEGYIDVDAGLKVKAEPARCEASLDITAKAAAECDVDARPGMVEVRCDGVCTIAADAQADCAAKGGLTCRGTPPDLKCGGTCYGACDLKAAAACDGTCRGTCDAGGNTQQNFEGRCAGMCDGTCDVEAGATCDGKCTGTCEYKPPSGMCEGGLEARCSASAEANVDCQGDCTGKATPPMVSAECEATVEAKAEANVQCYPPSLTFDYTFSAKAAGDANLQAEFRGLLSGLRLHYGGLLAALARAQGLLDVGGRLGDAGVKAVQSLAGELRGSGDVKVQFGGICAIAVLPSAGKMIADAGAMLAAQVEATGTVTAAIGGT